MKISIIKDDQLVKFNSLKNQAFLLMIIQYNNNISFILKASRRLVPLKTSMLDFFNNAFGF
jgi:hypothetical protein